MNPPVVGKGGKVMYNDTPHEFRSKTCFGHCVGTRDSTTGKVVWNYNVVFSDSVDHRSQAVIQMSKFIYSQPWFQKLLKEKSRAFHTFDNARTFASKENLHWTTIGFAKSFEEIRESSYVPQGKCHGKGICDKLFQKIGIYVETAEKRCYNIQDLAKAVRCGQRQANESKKRRTGETSTILWVYTYDIKKPSKDVPIIDLDGMSSSGAVT